MRRSINKFGWKLFGLAALFLPQIALAHEAYVLTPEEFQTGLKYRGYDALHALQNPHDLKIFIEVTLVVFFVFALNFIFQRSNLAEIISNKIERLYKFGPIIVRLAFSASIFFSALTWSFLGPELSIQNLSHAEFIRITMFLISILVLLGIYVEAAAFISLIIFAIASVKFGFYLATYLNYLGEIIALLLFGSRYFSVDRLIFGTLDRFKNFKKYQATIVRVCYGLALIYAAITIKLLHPILTETVVTRYNLMRFNHLFPGDPLLITFGAALAELLIGILIIIGFELRLTVIVSLVYITMSLLFFRELVWPHLMLYGISLNLIFEPQKLTLDNYLSRRKKV